MKYRVFLFAFVTFLITGLQAAREKEQFLRGNKFFEEHNTEEALKEYQEITNKGPALWYNIGVCYLTQKDYLNAYVALKRAQVQANSKLFALITPLIEQIQQELSQAFESEFMYFARWLAARCSLLWLQLIFLFFWWTYTVFSWLTIPALSRFKTVFLMLALATGFLTGTVWWVRSLKTGIVMEERSLFIGPHNEFHASGSVTPGQLVSIEQATESWYKVKDQHSSGWVERTVVEQIEL